MKKPHEDWFECAEDDLKFAKIGLREGFYSQVCFLSQQVIEKTLKGCIKSQGRAFPKTHKLVDLYHLCNFKWLHPYKDRIKLIDEFYIPTRYPDAIPGTLPTRFANEKDAKESISAAEEILDEARSKIR
jgi:HEPN domain-containing protein